MTSSSLKVGVIGAGGISHSHLPHLKNLTSHLYLYSESGADEASRVYGAKPVATLDELLELVDIVDILTPTPTHARIIERALLAGKDVITEKPFTRTNDDARRLHALAQSMNRRILPAHVVRFFPEYSQLKAAVSSGALGDLAVLRFSRAGASPAGTPWFADDTQSGGILMDQMIHDMDIARWIAGEVVQVSAIRSRSRSAEPLVESAHVLLTHESGAISQLTGFWGPPHLTFATDFSVTGTKGQLTHSSQKEQSYMTDLQLSRQEGTLVPNVNPTASPYHLQLREFLRALQTGASCRVTSEDGVKAVEIANAAIESAAVGQPITVTRRATLDA